MAPPRASQYVIYVGFLAILVVFSIVLRDDGFATASNLLNIVQQTAPVTVMAVGMVFVLTAGEIDLSIGSIVAIAALLAALVLRDWPWPVGVAAGLGAGALIGALNGAMIAYGRLPSFLVTLATMGVFAGVGRRMTNLKSIPIENDTFNALFGARSLFGVPSLVLWTVAAIGIGWFVFRETRFGAHVHATGDSARAAGGGHQGAAPALRRVSSQRHAGGARRPALCGPTARRALYARRGAICLP